MRKKICEKSRESMRLGHIEKKFEICPKLDGKRDTDRYISCICPRLDEEHHKIIRKLK